MTTVESGLRTEVMDHRGLVLLELIGELTALEGPELADVIDAVLERTPRNVQLGLRSLTFVDSGGMRALVQARHRALAANVPMQLLGPTPRFRKLLEVTGLDGVFDIV